MRRFRGVANGKSSDRNQVGHCSKMFRGRGFHERLRLLQTARHGCAEDGGAEVFGAAIEISFVGWSK